MSLPATAIFILQYIVILYSSLFVTHILKVVNILH